MFVLWLGAKNANNAFTFNHFTITTNLFYGCTYFHFIYSVVIIHSTHLFHDNCTLFVLEYSHIYICSHSPLKIVCSRIKSKHSENNYKFNLTTLAFKISFFKHIVILMRHHMRLYLCHKVHDNNHDNQ